MAVPWWPIVLYRDRLVNQSLVLYGSGALYASPPEILYGEQGDPRYLYSLSRPIVTLEWLTDSVTSGSQVYDGYNLQFIPRSRTLVFALDPFDLLTPSVDSSGREYAVLWARNAEFDFNTLFDQLGWVVKFAPGGAASYAEALQAIWEMVLLGPSLRRYEQGLLRAAGLPVANSAEIVRRIDSDGYHTLISTDTQVYRGVAAGGSPIVALGEQLVTGRPLTDTFSFLELEGLMSASAEVLSGLLLRVPLSSGTVAELTFANRDTDWEFVTSRPSEWRFPVGGTAADVEQFWADTEARVAAAGLDLEVVYSLPAAVNPMKRVIEDLLQNSLYVVSCKLSNLPQQLGGFSDRARTLLPADAIIVLQQNLDDVDDVYALETETSDTVGYGYHTDVPTEVISVGGTDLTLIDYTPMVAIS